MRTWIVAAALAAAAAVTGCSSSSDETQICPNAYRVQEAATLIRFKPGAGRDPTDVDFRADLGNIEVACAFSSRRQSATVELKVQMLVAQGPVPSGNRAAFEYAVGVIGPGGEHLQRQRFTAEVSFAEGRNRGSVTDEISVRLPYGNGATPGAYRIAVGLILTPDELTYNQRAAGIVPAAR